MSWPVLPLGDVADTALGKMLDRGKQRGHPLVPYLRNINVQWRRIDTSDLLTMELSPAEHERFAVESGDVLICEGGEIGRAAIWNGGEEYLAYQKALHRVRPHESLDARFLVYLLEHYARTGVLSKLSTGSTIAHLPQQKLRQIPVPQLPLREQRRIVAAIETHLSCLSAGEGYLAAGSRRVKNLKRATLREIIPGPDDYPAHWVVSTVGQAGRVELGRQRHPDWHTGPNMRPYLRVANVFEDQIDMVDLKEMHWPDGSFERFRLRPGDVLLNEGQSPELLGRPAIYRGGSPEVAFTNTLLRFKPNDEVLSDFALLVFRRYMHSGRFTREVRITTNIGHLSVARLKPIEFPIPPLGEQRELAAEARKRLESIDMLTRAIARNQSRSDALYQSILSSAFAGNLARDVESQLVGTASIA